VDHATDPEPLKHPGNFAVLDAKLAAGFGKVLHGELGRSINFLQEKPCYTKKCWVADKLPGTSINISKQRNVKAQFLSLKTS
jgi:hypothetical protein